MRSYANLYEIQEDLEKNKQSMIYILDKGKDYADSIIESGINHIRQEKETVEMVMKNLRLNCTTDEFFTRFFSNPDVLMVISEYLHQDVTYEDILRVKNGEIIFEESKPTETKQEKDTFVVINNMFQNKSKSKKYSNPSNIKHYTVSLKSNGLYSVIYKDENDLTNIFTLKDFINRTEVSRIGVSVVSLYGFPKIDGKTLAEDRDLTDRVFSGGKYSNYTIDMNTYYASGVAFLPCIMSIIKNLGYAEFLFDRLSKLITKCKEDGDTSNILFKFDVRSKKQSNKSSILALSSKNGYIYFDSDLNRKDTFMFVYITIKCIAEYLSWDLDSLLEKVMFFSPCDKTASYNEIQKDYSVKVIDIPSEVTENITIAQEDTNKYIPFYKCMKSHMPYPKSLKFTYKGNQHIVFPKDTNFGSAKKSNNNVFYSLGVLMVVIKVLMEEGVSLETICSINSRLFSLNNISTTPHTSNIHIDLGDGRYYVLNTNLGWDYLKTNLEKLFKELNIAKGSLQLGFNN